MKPEETAANWFQTSRRYRYVATLDYWTAMSVVRSTNNTRRVQEIAYTARTSHYSRKMSPAAFDSFRKAGGNMWGNFSSEHFGVPEDLISLGQLHRFRVVSGALVFALQRKVEHSVPKRPVLCYWWAGACPFLPDEGKLIDRVFPDWDHARVELDAWLEGQCSPEGAKP